MKLSIVTPTYNRCQFLNETIQSVISQEGKFEIDYQIQDGGANSDVLNLLKYWEAEINTGRFSPSCAKLRFRWLSEQDNGMYDAINKGFARTNGDIMAWINSDDVYHPHAFESVTQIFTQIPSVSWVSGIPNSINRHGSRSGWDKFPAAYSREFIKRGYYDAAYLDYGFNWIAQDSCFWKRSLWQEAGGMLDSSKKNAADFFLWRKFAQFSDLVKVETFLGSYRYHGEQITADPKRYRSELPNDRVPPYILKLLRKILKGAPYFRKYLIAKMDKRLLRLSGLEKSWLLGRVIRWSFQKDKWVLSMESIF